MANSGVDITIRVRGDAGGEPAPPPPSARAFLIREFANTLSRGTAGEIAASRFRLKYEPTIRLRSSTARYKYIHLPFTLI
jgi:hypothetical protein